MNRKIPLTVLAFALLILSAAFAQASATPPPKGTYIQVVVSHSVVAAEQKMTGDVVHVRNGAGECYLYAASFPLGNSISSSTTSGGELNIVSFTGNWREHAVDTYAAGMVEGTVNIKFTGSGGYVYTGPSFTFTLGGVAATVTTGNIFGGLLLEGTTAKHGTGDLTGFTSQGTGTGVTIYGVIVGDPALVGFSLIFETGMYSGPL